MSSHPCGLSMKYVPIALRIKIQNEGQSTQHHLTEAPDFQTQLEETPSVEVFSVLPHHSVSSSFKHIRCTGTRPGAGTQAWAGQGFLLLVGLMCESAAMKETAASKERGISAPQVLRIQGNGEGEGRLDGGRGRPFRGSDVFAEV